MQKGGGVLAVQKKSAFAVMSFIIDHLPSTTLRLSFVFWKSFSSSVMLLLK